MHLYMSGTPRNDPYQTVENRLCTHRLFSMHGDYEKAVLRWVKDLRSGILDAKAFLRAYPQHHDNILARDAKRREAQRNFGRGAFDWNTAELLSSVCEKLEGRPYPRAILLDSGAFTAWNKGEKVTVDQVKQKYSKFIDEAGDLFDEIWMINLDVIPGERGRDPTPAELDDAVRVSDINFEILVREFGDKILPVFHQGETDERLKECVAQVDGKSNYICVSPRNDLGEPERVKWSRDKHVMLHKTFPHIKTHGLATTGNEMVRSVNWYSGDSAAWVQHGGYGMIDIFHTPEWASGKKGKPHYMNYFVSFDGIEFKKNLPFRMGPSGVTTTLADAGVAMEKDQPLPVAEALLKMGVHPDEFPLAGKYFRHYAHRPPNEKVNNDAAKHYFDCSPIHREYIRSRVEAIGFPIEVTFWDSRVRNLVCMAVFVAFAEWAEGHERAPAQIDMLSGF